MFDFTDCPLGLSGKVFDVLVLELSGSQSGFSNVGGIGVYLAIFALGAIAGITFIQKWKQHFESLSFYVFLSFVSGVLFILLGAFLGLVSNLILTFFLGAMLNMSVVAAQVNIQKNGEDAFLGRIFAAWRFFAVLGGSIGAFLSGILSDQVGPNSVLMLTGCLLMVPWAFSFMMRKKEN